MANSIKPRRFGNPRPSNSPPRIPHLIFLAALLVASAFTQTKQTGIEKPEEYLKQAVISQVGDVTRLHANSPRPLLQALDALRQKYGWLVSYEDPQFHGADLVKSQNEAPEELPAGGEFTVEFPARAPDEEKTLGLIVDAYNRTKNPGRFEVRRVGGDYCIVGIAARDDKGAIAPRPPLLDSPVTIESAERSVADTVNLIGRAAAADPASTFAIGVAPSSFIARTMVKIGGSKMPARDLLAQCLKASQRRFSWRLLFDPASKGYFLSLDTAPTKTGA
ncbi:MAG TPA: hypothetical protein VND65_08420 [Candidatus Binatia bacterium]|nr:hypothetical protein [Candidatus Binatia bacterium]